MWIEIFRSGEHTSSNGNTQSYSAEDLNEIATKYNQKLLESESYIAPLVKGHPIDNTPAFGWVEKLARKGDKLLAKVKDLTKDIIDQVRNGAFKKVSISLYDDKLLRHVGLLGAASPAVQGLKPLEFTEESFYSDFSGIDESESNETSELNLLKQNLENSEKEKNKLNGIIEELKLSQKQNELTNFCETLANDNKLNSEQKELTKDLISSAQNLDKDFALKLQESLTKLFVKKETTFDFREYATNRPNTNKNENIFSRGNISQERLALHNQIAEIMKQDSKINYEDAMKIALG